MNIAVIDNPDTWTWTDRSFFLRWADGVMPPDTQETNEKYADASMRIRILNGHFT